MGMVVFILFASVYAITAFAENKSNSVGLNFPSVPSTKSMSIFATNDTLSFKRISRPKPKFSPSMSPTVYNPLYFTTPLFQPVQQRTISFLLLILPHTSPLHHLRSLPSGELLSQPRCHPDHPREEIPVQLDFPLEVPV